MYRDILYQVEDPIATITLNRPKSLNAWTVRMGAEVKHAMGQAEKDERAVAILLTGAGRGFCAGADLDRLRGISEGRREEELPPELDADWALTVTTVLGDGGDTSVRAAASAQLLREALEHLGSPLPAGAELTGVLNATGRGRLGDLATWRASGAVRS